MSIKMSVDKYVPLDVISSGHLKEYIQTKIISHDREDVDDPLYVCDIGQVVTLYELWKRTLPRIKPFYAVKCNDDPVFLKCLAHLGTGFDCASKSELKLILDMGVKPNDVVFANPCKQTSHVKFAARKGVTLMTFDNEMELHKIASHFPSARLLVRIKADDPHAVCQLGAKFGCSIYEACRMLHIAYMLGLKVVGVSFHVGSGCQTPDAYCTALEMSHRIFIYAENIGYHFTVLDIGGGFPGSAKQIDLFHQVASSINSSIDKLFTNFSDLIIIAEPGRYFAASSFSLVVQITSKRQISSDDTIMYYVNDGVYGSFNCIMFDHATVEPHPLKDHCGDPVYSSSVWGPTCDSMDKICVSYLPNLGIGEWLVFYDMGAYTRSAHSEFNGFKIPPIYYYINRENSATFEAACGGMLTGRLAADPVVHIQAISTINSLFSGLPVACS